MPLSTASVGVTLSPQAESVWDLLQSQISSELLVVVYLHVSMAYFNDPLSIPPSLPSFLSSLSRLELLSTITEIRGYLRIDDWRQQTFPYLRNLRRVGSPNGTTIRFGGGCPDDYSVSILRNARLQQIDLSSLESISGGGLLFLGNPELCYVGNLSMYLDDPTAQPQCLSRTQPFRKDPQTCSECQNTCVTVIV